MEIPVTFGEWLRQRRSELRLTRKELAGCAGCSIAMLRKIEDGERRPSSQIAELIANCLDVPPADRPDFVKAARGMLGANRLPPITQRVSGLNRGPNLNLTLPRINLPVNPAPLIGRQYELEQIGELLRDPQCRLLTLAGPGGIGKTRLAIEAASQKRDFFPDGVYFVPLAQVNSSRFLVPVIADAIRFAYQRENLTSPQNQLFNYLQEKRALLLLDNIEHLLAEPGIELLSDLLDHASQVTLLVTSREALGLYREWLFEVQGLPVPEEGQAELIPHGTSVELFLQCSRRARVGFVAAASDYPAIVRICRLVGGMPLGIELAAAWVRTLTCTEIAQEIERDLDFLSTSARDLPVRHRSLRTIFEHSWELLSKEEQQALLRLSLFQGGFRREAAEVLAGADLPILSSLVSKSFIRRSDQGRYDLHELIQQFAFERLTSLPEELTQLQAGHARYYLAFFAKEGENLRSPAQRDTLARLAVEMDNFRIAWDWAVRHGEFTWIEPTLRAFATYFDHRGWFQEGLDLLARAAEALEAGGEKSPFGRQELLALGHILACQGLLALRLAQNDQALELLKRSLAILRPLNEPRVLVEAVAFLGIAMAFTSNYASSLELFGEGLEIAMQTGDRWFAALCLTEQISIPVLMGKSENSYERYLSAVADWRAIGDPRFTAFGLYFLSSSAVALGKYAEARAALEESAALNLSVGDRWGLGSAYRGLGLVAQAQGEHAQALEEFQQSLDIFGELGARWEASRVFAEMGRSEFALGNDLEAERVWRESLRMSLQTQAALVGLEALVGLASLQAKRGDVAGALEALSMVLEHPAGVQETRNRAAQLRAELAVQLSPQEMEAIQRRAGQKTFETAAEEILRQSG